MPVLFRNRRVTIGVLAGWQYYWTATPLSYLNPIYRGIRQAAADLGCNLLLGCGMGESAASSDPLRPAWFTPSAETDFVPIGPWNTDGIIAVNPLHTAARSHDCQELRAAGHPVVFIASGESGPTIVADNATGIRAAIQHLIGHGHQRIAFIAGSREDLAGDTGARLQAYWAALQEFGITTDERIVAYGRHITAGGHAAMHQIMKSGAPFTAVLASNDESALGAMQALREANLRVPQDVAIIGFDDRTESAVQEPALSSVAVPLFEMGYRAVEQLIRQIEGEPPPNEPIKVATHLVLRASCGCGYNAKLPEDPTAAANLPPKPTLAPPLSFGVTNAAEPEEIKALRQQLTKAFIASVERTDPAALSAAVDALLRQAAQGWDDAAIWQAAFSVVSDELPILLARWPQVEQQAVAHHLLEEARATLAASTWRRHRQYVVDQRRTLDQVGLLTAHLLTALDETHVYAVLARHLPEMGIHMAALVTFEPEGDDAVAWGQLRRITPPSQPTIRFACRQFPPTGLFPTDQPFSLALLPLVSPYGTLGFVAFDTQQLDLYGAIVQQMAAALHTAQLYRQATEGRRLAEEANRMKSRFLSTISHELRTPLNLIMGLSGVVLQEGEEGHSPIPESTQKDIRRIHAYAQHLGGLIGDVIDLATLDAGQLRLNKELVDLGDALQLVADSGSQLTADKGLAWRADIPATGPWIWGDRTRLRQVVLNLIHNAIKFTNHGEISLSLNADDSLVTIAVRDTGLGIPLEEQDVIFDAFRRSERSIALGYPGLGLGLAICKMLVELHGGTIGLHSTGIDGEGSTFSLTLPVESPPHRRPAQREESPQSRQSVLLLSSQPTTNQRLRSLLSQGGILVREAPLIGPADWQPELHKVSPDVIVLDVTIQSDLNWATLQAIKESQSTRDVPILLYAAADKGESLLSLDYLTKPIAVAELTRALDRQWGLAEPIQAARTILIVDDEPDTLELHARIVQAQAASNRVLLARNGLDALQILRQEKIDLVLLDLQMPILDGFRVLETMRDLESTRQTPVIVITGKSLSGQEMERLNQGVALVLQKGLFRPDETAAHITSTLERKRNLGVDTQRLVRQAMAYIHEHYCDPITRPMIARHVNISEDYLTFCFRQELGTTPIKYLQRCRVNRAKLLLKHSQKSITEVALDVGFSDSGYFSRIFHREVGVSPEEFRRA